MIVKIQKHQSIHWWMDGYRSHTDTHTQWNTASHEGNVLLSLAAIGVDLKCILVSEISEVEKDKYHVISLAF